MHKIILVLFLNLFLLNNLTVSYDIMHFDSKTKQIKKQTHVFPANKNTSVSSNQDGFNQEI